MTSTTPTNALAHDFAPVTDASAKLLNTFPVEVLNLITGELITETSDFWIIRSCFPHLQAFRSACRKFAYIPRLLEILFRGFRLIATADHLEHLDKVDLRRIIPHVTRLTFFPPFHSWSMTREAFDKIVLAQAVQQYCKDHGLRLRTEHNFNDGLHEVHQRLFNQQWNGQPPYTKGELDQGYARHMAQAQKGKELMASERLRTSWINTLRVLTRCTDFRIASPKFDDSRSDMPSNPPCDIFVHHHDSDHKGDVCSATTAATGDAILEVAINCLAQAGTRPQALDIKHWTLGNFGWDQLQGWHQLDLSRLKTLQFRPQADRFGDWDNWAQQRHDVMTHAARDAADGLLAKCHSTLKTLRIKEDCPIDWPSSQIFAFPQLEYLDLHGMCVNNGSLAKMLPLMPKLTFYGLACTTGTEEWKAMLDALRDHPQQIQIEWDQIACHSCAEVSLYCRKGHLSEDEVDEDEWMDISRSLQNYLAGQEKWNRTLRLWFEEGHEDEEDD